METKVELTEKMKNVMDSVEKMTVMELADLVKALEDKFGVSAAAPVAVAAAGAAGHPVRPERRWTRLPGPAVRRANRWPLPGSRPAHVLLRG